MKQLQIIIAKGLLLLSLPASLFAQVDVTKYASEDLFEVKPIYSKENLETNQESDIEINQINPEISKGLELWSEGEYDEAVSHFEKMEELYDDEAVFSYFIGHINFERGRYSEAKTNFQEALRKNPLLLEASYMQGLILANQDSFKDANKLFQNLSQIHKYEAHGFHGLAVTAMNQGQAYNAVKFFNKCITADSSFIEAYIPLTSIYIYLGSIKKAQKTIESGVTMNPTWEEGIMVRAMIAVLKDQNIEQFEEDISRLIELDPNNYHYHSMKGFLHVELKQYHEGVKQFQKAYELEADTLRRGVSKFSSKFKKEESIQRALNYYFENYGQNEEVRNYLDRGICEFMIDNTSLALSYLDSAIQIEKNPVTYTFIGSINRTRFRKFSETIEAFTESIRLDSSNWMAYSYRGEAYLASGDFEHAYKDYNRVVKLRPRSKEGYKNRANILMKYNYNRQAFKDFSYVIAIDTTDYDAFYNRAIASLNMNENQQAIFDLTRIVRDKPKDGEAYYLLKRCYLDQKDSLQALSYLDSASKYSKYKDEYHEELIESASKLGKTQPQNNGLDRLVKYFSYKRGYRLRRAKFLIEQKDYLGAKKDLEYIVKRDKRSGEAFYYLAQVSKKLSSEKDYEKYIRKANKLGYRHPK